MRRYIGVGLATLATSALLACGSSSSSGATGPSAGSSTTIMASSVTTGGAYGSGGNYFFSPNPDSVAVGTTVTFQFGSVVHNVMFDGAVPGAPANIPNSSNASVTRTFSTAGTFPFHCSNHNFSGTLIVH